MQPFDNSILFSILFLLITNPDADATSCFKYVFFTVYWKQQITVQTLQYFISSTNVKFCYTMNITTIIVFLMLAIDSSPDYKLRHPSVLAEPRF